MISSPCFTFISNPDMPVSETIEKIPSEFDATEQIHRDQQNQQQVFWSESGFANVGAGYKSRGSPSFTYMDTVGDTASDTLPSTPKPTYSEIRFYSPFPGIEIPDEANIDMSNYAKENANDDLRQGKVPFRSNPMRKRDHKKQDASSKVTNHLSPIVPSRYTYFPRAFLTQKRDDLARDHPKASTDIISSIENVVEGAHDQNTDICHIPLPPSFEHSLSTYSVFSFLDPLSNQLSSSWMLQPSFSRQPSMVGSTLFSRQSSKAVPPSFSRQTSRVTFDFPYMHDLPDECVPPPPPPSLLYRFSSRMGCDLMSQPIIASPYPVVFYPRQFGSHKKQRDCLTPPSSKASIHRDMFSTQSKLVGADQDVIRHSYEQHTVVCHHPAVTTVTEEKVEAMALLTTVKPPVSSSLNRKKKKRNHPNRDTVTLPGSARPILVVNSKKQRKTSESERICACPNSRYVPFTETLDIHVANFDSPVVVLYTQLSQVVLRLLSKWKSLLG